MIPWPLLPYFTYHFTERRINNIKPRRVSPTPKKLWKKPKLEAIWSLEWEDGFAIEALRTAEKCEEQHFEIEAVKATIKCEQFVMQTDEEASVLDAMDAAKRGEEEENDKVIKDEETAAVEKRMGEVVAAVGWPAEGGSHRTGSQNATVKGEFGYCRHCEGEPCVWIQNRRSMKEYDCDHVSDVGVKNFPNDGGKSRRFPLYRMMSRIYHGPINSRESLPKCVEEGIKNIIPSPDGSYVRFRY